MDTQSREAFEIKWLLEAIYACYGYDFRDYAGASLKRRILNRLELSDCRHISDMVSKMLYDSDFFELFLQDMSITVTEMFRDPYVFLQLRERVIPRLKTYSRINIWHAGCATGEEVYSLAILLHEEGLLEKTRIYATDFNNHSLEIARKGIYSQDLAKYQDNYLLGGGKKALSEYYQYNYDAVIMKAFLRKRITFAYHNLTRDQVFAEMHLIMCRNVLIYFNQALQNKVLNLLINSLVHKGFLVLGDKETLEFTSMTHQFDDFEPRAKIYRKTAALPKANQDED
ncbi:protein-glutamate O-methyltransferase CheR [Thalassomonas sp. RHCl1]|uniref:CheR family methyltransferase n=1 Tax=Thalassomonas sp. RHCl1 TaxID=2995320 RepID=UPI00248C8D5E|nr:protein-glutamate O-methyltransferase CheR [Thalassomonas sp. RHCl1]